MPHERFGIERLARRHTFELDITRVKMITTVAQIDAFHDTYGSDMQMAPGFEHHGIDWAKVAEQYSGIVISPYRYERRLNWRGDHPNRVSDWYYGWDCSSGCIWDTSVLRLLSVEDSNIESERDEMIEESE